LNINLMPLLLKILVSVVQIRPRAPFLNVISTA
jgi:hypothetical protein